VGSNIIESRLAEGEQKHLLLLKEATDLLCRLDIISTEELASLLERRQILIDWMQDFDESLVQLDSSDSGMRAALVRFRTLQEETIRKVLEIDALVMGLAKDKCSSIEGRLLSLTKTKNLTQRFTDSDIKPRHNLDGIL